MQWHTGTRWQPAGGAAASHKWSPSFTIHDRCLKSQHRCLHPHLCGHTDGHLGQESFCCAHLIKLMSSGPAGLGQHEGQLLHNILSHPMTANTWDNPAGVHARWDTAHCSQQVELPKLDAQYTPRQCVQRRTAVLLLLLCRLHNARATPYSMTGCPLTSGSSRTTTESGTSTGKAAHPPGASPVLTALYVVVSTCGPHTAQTQRTPQCYNRQQGLFCMPVQGCQWATRLLTQPGTRSRRPLQRTASHNVLCSHTPFPAAVSPHM